MRYKTFLPGIKKENDFQGEMSDEDLLFEIIRTSPYQGRKSMSRHLLLDRAAAAKAQDMADKNYFAHFSPDGISANQNVLNFGYLLPDYYPVNGNNVESLSIGGTNPQENADGWLGSPKHRAHVYGENSFYAQQQCIGIGRAVNKSDGRTIYVFISAPCS